MNENERRNKIVNYLRIKPVNHGQVYTFQIAIPPSEVLDISFERSEYLKLSFAHQGTNLIPLIVRRTEAYSEEEDYEVVYGIDWLLIAKEVNIEKLWVWVFDMTDEEVTITKQEMQQLMGNSNPTPNELELESDEKGQLKSVLELLDRVLQQITILNKKIELVTASVKEFKTVESQKELSEDTLITKVTKIIKEVIAKELIEDVVNKISESSSYRSSSVVKQKDYESMTVMELKVIASEQNIKGRARMKRQELITAIKKNESR